jgi:hypothetical protein
MVGPNAMFRCAAFEKWLDDEGTNLVNELMD